jgi:hypothetical protein
MISHIVNTCYEFPRNYEMIHIRSTMEISPSNRRLRSFRDFEDRKFLQLSPLTSPAHESEK